MGDCVSRFGKKSAVELAMVGLDGSGKTTILYNLKKKDFWNVKRTVGYNLENIRVRNKTFNLWDIGGVKNIRPLWRYHFIGKHGVIFVIDSSDVRRLDEAITELWNITKDPVAKNVRILVLANKQDKSGAIKPDDIKEKLTKENTFKNIEWEVMPASALAGHGLKKALLWFRPQT
ncbi:ADP-ribosylation factor 6-like [Styela clava]